MSISVIWRITTSSILTATMRGYKDGYKKGYEDGKKASSDGKEDET